VISTLTGSHLVRVCNSLFRHDQWNIGIVYAPISHFLESSARPQVQWLRPHEPGKFLADPFAIKKGETIHLLCEEFDYRTFKGRIVTIEITGRGAASSPAPVIETPVHMSYPYLLQYEGEIYCIPETSKTREVSIYKAQKFPYSWKKVALILSDFPAVDSTVFQYKGHWWLACSIVNKQSSSNELYIYYAPGPLGPWKQHGANPVKRDIHSSRPAGTPFMHNGSLYRPSQDCSSTFGGRVVINRVVNLTPTDFKEESVAVVEPYGNCPYPDGLHTLSAVGNITLVDAKRTIFVKKAFRRALRQNFAKVKESFRIL